jgi:hypothetical protein
VFKLVGGKEGWLLRLTMMVVVMVVMVMTKAGLVIPSGLAWGR